MYCTQPPYTPANMPSCHSGLYSQAVLSLVAFFEYFVTASRKEHRKHSVLSPRSDPVMVHTLKRQIRSINSLNRTQAMRITYWRWHKNLQNYLYLFCGLWKAFLQFPSSTYLIGKHFFIFTNFFLMSSMIHHVHS